MRPLLFFIVSVLMTTSSFSQKKELYYNEKYQRIEKNDFDKRLKSKLFIETVVENDTAKFHKLRFFEFFGVMDSTKNKQLRSQLTSEYPINPNKTWFINYMDTLPDAKKMHKEAGTYYIDTIAKDSVFVPRYRHFKKLDREKYNYHHHVSSTKSFQKYLERWPKKVNSNIEYFYIYVVNKGFPLDFSPKVRMYRDPKNVVRKVFNDGQVPYHDIILFPNGDFYVTTADNWERKVKLLKEKIYTQEKEKWLKQLAKVSL